VVERDGGTLVLVVSAGRRGNGGEGAEGSRSGGGGGVAADPIGRDCHRRSRLARFRR